MSAAVHQLRDERNTPRRALVIARYTEGPWRVFAAARYNRWSRPAVSDAMFASYDEAKRHAKNLAAQTGLPILELKQLGPELTPKATAASCLRRASLFTDKEREFLESVRSWRTELTDKQLAWLYKLYLRLPASSSGGAA